MAPSAVETALPVSKLEISEKQEHEERHVHGGQDKTPLEAISHGPLIHPGMKIYVLNPEYGFSKPIAPKIGSLHLIFGIRELISSQRRKI